SVSRAPTRRTRSKVAKRLECAVFVFRPALFRCSLFPPLPVRPESSQPQAFWQDAFGIRDCLLEPFSLSCLLYAMNTTARRFEDFLSHYFETLLKDNPTFAAISAGLRSGEGKLGQLTLA